MTALASHHIPDEDRVLVIFDTSIYLVDNSRYNSLQCEVGKFVEENAIQCSKASYGVCYANCLVTNSDDAALLMLRFA